MDFDGDNFNDEHNVSSSTSSTLYKKRKTETPKSTNNKKTKTLTESEKLLQENQRLEIETCVSNACQLMKVPIQDVVKFEKAELILIFVANPNITLKDLVDWDEFFYKICTYDWTTNICHVLNEYFSKCPCLSTLLKSNREIKNIQTTKVFSTNFNESYLTNLKTIFSIYKPNSNKQPSKRQCINLKKQ